MSTDASSPLSDTRLPAVGLVAELNEEDRALLSSYGLFSYLEAGQLVIRQQSAQNCLYFVISGTLHAKRADEGREVLLSAIGQGEWFGEINIFDPSAASASVSAVSASQIWSIGREELLSYFAVYPEAAVRLLIGIATLLSRRVRQVSQKLVSHAEYESLLSGGADKKHS